MIVTTSLVNEFNDLSTLNSNPIHSVNVLYELTSLQPKPT